MSAQNNAPAAVPVADRKSNEDVFYGDGKADAIAGDLKFDMEMITAKLELDEKGSAELARSTGAALDSMGLSSEQAKDYFSVFRQLVLKPATDEQRDTWRYEATRKANATYGVDEAKTRIAKVNAYLRGDQRLKGQLEVGVGNHPRIVTMLLERAHELRLPKVRK